MLRRSTENIQVFGINRGDVEDMLQTLEGFALNFVSISSPWLDKLVQHTN